MLKLDRVVAIFILLFCLGYAWLAFDYQLLPFEKNMVFKPNTLPLGLAAIGVILSLAIAIAPRPKETSVLDESTVDRRDPERDEKKYDYIRPVSLVILMIVYALTLRPVGFVLTTSGFLCAGALILGERRFHFLIPIACGSAFSIWYLVQELLGIYMNPWPLLFNGA